MPTIINYGIGGYDESKPNNNVISVEELPDDPAPSSDPTSTAVSTLVQALADATSFSDIQQAAANAAAILS